MATTSHISLLLSLFLLILSHSSHVGATHRILGQYMYEFIFSYHAPNLDHIRFGRLIVENDITKIHLKRGVNKAEFGFERDL